MRAERSIFTLTGVVLLLFAAPAFAGLNRWTGSGPEGGTVTSMVFDPAAGIVYAGTAGGGVFRASAAANPQWQSASGNLPQLVITALAVDSTSQPVLYAGTGSGHVFKSVDGGESWSEKGFFGWDRGINSVAIDGRRTRVFVTTAEAVVISRDDGETWSYGPRGAHGSEIRSVAVASTGRVFVSTAQNVLVSEDGGETWQGSLGYGPSLLAGHPESSTVFAAQGPNVYASREEAGADWRALPVLDAVVTALLPTDRGLYAATGKRLYRYDESRSEWTSLGSVDHSVSTLVLMAASSCDCRYAGTAGGIYVSAGDDLWQPANRGMNALHVSDIDTVDEYTAFAVTDGGLFDTADGGATWQKVAAFIDEPRQVAIGRGTVYVAGKKGIHASGDHGVTWETVTPRVPQSLPPSLSLPSLAATRSSSGMLYALFADDLAKSRDGGRNWSSALPPPPPWIWVWLYNVSLEADRDDPDTFYVASDIGLYRSINGGPSWSAISTQSIGAVAGDRMVIHAARMSFFPGGGGIMTSLDAGRSWSDARLTDERVQAIAIDPIDSRRAYAGTASGRVYRTEDFGVEWTLFSDGLRSAAVNRLVITDSGNRIYAATAGGVYEYRYGPALPFERLPDDPLRLPRLIRQLLTGARSSTSPALEAAFSLPAIGTVRGAGGTVFRTDVTLSNGRSADQEVMIAWLPQGNANGAAVSMFQATVPPSIEDTGGTLTISDLADELRLEGLGSLVVIAVNAAGELDASAAIDGFARIRSASSCGPGSVSQSFAAVPLGGASSRRARSLGLRHEAAYRTNAGILNLGETTREFTVVVDGQRRSERFTVTVPPFAPVQAAVPDHDYGAVALTVISDGAGGPWVAYGSSVDNGSGDAWAAVAMPLGDR
jgi:photosystem II stability/assembly factor-like uncharacterized protein